MNLLALPQLWHMAIFGPLFEKVLAGPHFHRLHHMIVDPSRPNLHNCNFSHE